MTAGSLVATNEMPNRLLTSIATGTGRNRAGGGADVEGDSFPRSSTSLHSDCDGGIICCVGWCPSSINGPGAAKDGKIVGRHDRGSSKIGLWKCERALGLTSASFVQLI